MDIGLPPDFKDFLRLLDAEGVEYLRTEAIRLRCSRTHYGTLSQTREHRPNDVPPLRIELATMISGVDFVECYGGFAILTISNTFPRGIRGARPTTRCGGSGQRSISAR